MLNTNVIFTIVNKYVLMKSQHMSFIKKQKKREFCVLIKNEMLKSQNLYATMFRLKI